ncbi:hydantoinase/oxoprolinase N-terminal domain-containing protein [Roseiflexus castenholzii]|uniref:hydantoinase/oxoprolinase N-terminal domain-containing protein n=1 Tax=Roseiflexus castenholzii TaxID=120962 RepID=UPI003C7B9308
MSYRIGVDVGGTFTDLMLFDEESGRYWRHKTPSTPHDPSEAVLAGIAAICQQAGIAPSQVAQIMHGTTVATNVILESKGARVGLVTTEGFKQILHLARSQTPGPLAGWMIMIKPEPPATLADTREVRERMSARGDPLTRPPEAVQRDVRYGLVSREKALNDYGVVLTDTLDIDMAATEAKRAELAAARGEIKGFDFGPPLEELLANAEAETGLPAPRKPQPVRWAMARAARRERIAQPVKQHEVTAD